MGRRNEALLTLEGYHALCAAAPDGVRYEVVEGRAVLMTSPSYDHQRGIARLMYLLDAQLPSGLAVVQEWNWVLWEIPRLGLRIPDLRVVAVDEQGDPAPGRPPLLVVEFLSPSTRATDLGAKRAEYARAGASSYWTVDLAVPAIEAMAGVTGGFRTVASAKGREPLTLQQPFPVTVLPDDLVRPSRLGIPPRGARG